MLTSTSSCGVAPAVLSTASSTFPPAQSPDFICGYADYADVYEIHRLTHEWIATALIGSILNQCGITFTNGEVKTPFDMWLALLSGSGVGRNTSIYTAQSLVDEAFSNLAQLNVPNPISKAAWGSRIAMQQNLAEKSTGLFVWEELSAILKTLASPGWNGAKEWLTNCYDNFKVPDSIRYRVTNKKSDTPPLLFNEAPRISLLATSSWEWFINSMEPGDTMGGFLPRWLLIRIPPSGKVLPRPKLKDQSLRPALVGQLQQISNLSGSADWSQAQPTYDAWYALAKKRFATQPNRGLAEPFFNRLRVQTIKLAVIFEVSQSGSLIVSPSAMQRAVKVAKGIETTLFEMLPTGMSREGAESEKMQNFVRDSKAAGVTQNQLTRAFQHWKLRDRNDRISTLLQGDAIRVFQRSSSGRVARVFVHSDFINEHAKKFPNDTPYRDEA